MNPTARQSMWLVALVAVLMLLPLVDERVRQVIGLSLTEQLTLIFIYSILALGLNVVVGYTGLLHLGIAAFFGIGVYITGILTVAAYPFQIGFLGSLVCATLGAALMGFVLGAPTLRLRGDYLAIVTLGFGEVVRFTLRNLEEITAGKRGLNPIPPPVVPKWLSGGLDQLQGNFFGEGQYKLYYFIALIALVVVVSLLMNLERSRLGRAWVAVREDELAASCMGINTARVKLSAFSLGAALAGAAGALYATTLQSTADPDAFDFNRSIVMLCCVILGGLGSLRGTLLGVLLLIGFDNALAPALDAFIQNADINPSGSVWLTFSNWKLMIFGLALVLMMRYRPEGLLPSARVRQELHTEPTQPGTLARAQ